VIAFQPDVRVQDGFVDRAHGQRRSGRTPIQMSAPDLMGAMKSLLSEDCGLSGINRTGFELNNAD